MRPEEALFELAAGYARAMATTGEHDSPENDWLLRRVSASVGADGFPVAEILEVAARFLVLVHKVGFAGGKTDPGRSEVEVLERLASQLDRLRYEVEPDEPAAERRLSLV